MAVNVVAVQGIGVAPVYSGYDLERAIDQGDSQKVLEMMQGSNLSNQPLPNGHLPLHFAIRREKSDVVKLMLEQQPSIDLLFKDDQGLSAIDHAMIGKNPQIIGICLGRSIGKNFDMAQSQPISASSMKQVEELRSEVEVLRSGTLFRKLPPLHEAARKGDLHTIQEAWKKRVDLDAYDQNGMTPLHHAALAGKVEVVRWFLKHHRQSTQILARNEGYSRGRILATKWTSFTVTRAREMALLAQNEGRSVLHFATLGGHPLIMECLFKRRDVQESVNIPDANGKSPLHYAAALEDLSKAKMLVEKGGDPFDTKGSFSPLQAMLALANQRSKIRDPLQLSASQIAIFACMATSLAAHYCQDTLPMADCLWIGAQSLSFLIGLGKAKSVGLVYSLFCAGLFSAMEYKNYCGLYSSQETCSNYLSNFPFIRSGDTTALRWGLAGVCGLQALRCMQVAKNALSGLATCWKNRCLETYRPIRNAVMHALTGASACMEIAPIVKVGCVGKDVLDAWDQRMEEERGLFQDIHGEIRLSPFSSLKIELPERLLYIYGFLCNYFSRKATNSVSTLRASQNAEVICADKAEPDCIRALAPSTNKEHAQYILNFSGLIDTCKQAYRKMSLRWHPDRPSGDHSVFIKVQESAEMLDCAQ